MWTRQAAKDFGFPYWKYHLRTRLGFAPTGAESAIARARPPRSRHHRAPEKQPFASLTNVWSDSERIVLMNLANRDDSFRSDYVFGALAPRSEEQVQEAWQSARVIPSVLQWGAEEMEKTKGPAGRR
jgi:hypothetical protein